MTLGTAHAETAGMSSPATSRQSSSLRRYGRSGVVLSLWIAAGLAGCFQGPPREDRPAERDPLGVNASPMLVDGEYKLERNLGGEDYVVECRSLGVPVPDRVMDLDNGWTFNSNHVQEPFVLQGLSPELWLFMAPGGGGCMALPRMPELSLAAESLNMICMAPTGETCFFAHEDLQGNQKNESVLIPPGQSLGPNDPMGFEIGDFVGGTDLETSPAGPCTDCHIGANPFIIHPGDVGFDTELIPFPTKWPVPVVPPSFPGNPPPIEQLGPTVADPTEDCNTCHSAHGSAGRLPLVSDRHPGFCNFVLEPALTDENGTNGTPPTMPPGAGPTPVSNGQTQWLRKACEAAPGQGHIVRYELPPSIDVFPPQVIAPYACTQHVTVSGFIPGASVSLYRVGSALPGHIETVTPYGETYAFELDDKLNVGDQFMVAQTYGGQTAASGVVTTISHLDHYEQGLPAPTIAPAPLYECATHMAVRHARGATIEVTKTEATSKLGGGKAWSEARTRAGTHSWMDMGAEGPFDVGDDLVATQTICDDVSDPSEVAVVEPAPNTIPPVELVPPMVGQHLLTLKAIVQGARVWLDELPALSVFDAPSIAFRRMKYDLTHSPLGPISAGDQFMVGQQLCQVSSQPAHGVSAIACDSAALESFVPEVVTPRAGDDFIMVQEARPGALIRVFAAGGVELGNGTGAVIQLSRALTVGESVAVTQQFVPMSGSTGCTPNRAIVVVVQ